jgi:hypothetical protein
VFDAAGTTIPGSTGNIPDFGREAGQNIIFNQGLANIFP